MVVMLGRCGKEEKVVRVVIVQEAPAVVGHPAVLSERCQVSAKLFPERVIPADGGNPGIRDFRMRPPGQRLTGSKAEPGCSRNPAHPHIDRTPTELVLFGARPYYGSICFGGQRLL